MKYLLFILALLCCSLSASAQIDSVDVKKPVYSVRRGFYETQNTEIEKQNEFKKYHLHKAGLAMERSSNLAISAISTAAVGGACFTVGACTGKKKTGMYVTGGIFTAASLACTLASITFHMDAGRELKLSAGEVVYKF